MHYAAWIAFCKFPINEYDDEDDDDNDYASVNDRIVQDQYIRWLLGCAASAQSAMPYVLSS